MKKKKGKTSNSKEKTKNKLTKENVKAKVLDFFKTTKEIIQDNKLVTIYFIGAVINGIIIRWITIHKPLSIRPMMADLVVSLLFVSLYFLISKKHRFAYLILISVISSVVCISNAIYYSYYSSFISITFLSFALTNTETGDSNPVGDLIQLKTFIFVWLPIALAIYHFKTKKKETNLFYFDS